MLFCVLAISKFQWTFVTLNNFLASAFLPNVIDVESFHNAHVYTLYRYWHKRHRHLTNGKFMWFPQRAESTVKPRPQLFSKCLCNQQKTDCPIRFRIIRSKQLTHVNLRSPQTLDSTPVNSFQNTAYMGASKSINHSPTCDWKFSCQLEYFSHFVARSSMSSSSLNDPKKKLRQIDAINIDSWRPINHRLCAIEVGFFYD